METQQARYLTLEFTCKQEGELFPSETGKLYFIQQAEKWLFPETAFIAWALTETEAVFMIEHPRDINAFKSVVHKFNRKYSRYLRKKTKDKSKLITSKLVYLQEYSKADLRDLVKKIHLTPIWQGLGNNFTEYPWTSYLQLLNSKHCKLEYIEVISWFGSQQNYRKQHHNQLAEITGK